MLVRVYYTYKNASQNTSWGDMLFDVESPSQVLKKFKEILPQFALERIISVRMKLLSESEPGKEYPLYATLGLCDEFVRENAK